MEWFLIYLLSVVGSVGKGFAGFGFVGILIALLALAISYGGLYCIAEERAKYGRDESEEAFEQFKKIRSFAMKFLVCATIVWTIGLLTPDKRDVREAYLMVEGAKIVNAENGEKAVNAFVERADKFFEVVEKKIPDATTK